MEKTLALQTWRYGTRIYNTPLSALRLLTITGAQCNAYASYLFSDPKDA